MKKIFLLLTLAIAVTPICIATTNQIGSQGISTTENYGQTKDNRQQPVTWRGYCENKISSAKSVLSNGYLLVKNNPKTTISIVLNVALICAITHVILSNKALDKDRFKFKSENEGLISKLDNLRSQITKQVQENNNLAENITKLTSENNNLLLKLDSLKAANDTLLSKIKEQAAKISELEKAILEKTKSQVKEKLIKQISTLNKLVEELKTKLSFLITLTNNQKCQIEALTQNETNVLILQLREIVAILLKENDQLRANKFPWLPKRQ